MSRTVETSCQGKRRYATWTKATHAAKGARRREHRVLTGYHCRHCGGFHIGNDMSQGKPLGVMTTPKIIATAYRRARPRAVAGAPGMGYHRVPDGFAAGAAELEAIEGDSDAYAVDTTEYAC